RSSPLHLLLTAKIRRTFSCIRSLVKWGVAALLTLVTGLKIIDFSGQSSFATASICFLKPFGFFAQ
ncbi:MAG: hypothetical protein KF898_10395, partial [Parachlamydiales bacterium]|nr:hypothetical protein [Candidatus Acheromyda pituitae]